MSVPVLLVLAVAVVAVLYLAFEIVQQLRRPPELRGDWWADFERQFRAYARACERRPEWRRHWDRPGGLT